MSSSDKLAVVSSPAAHSIHHALRKLSGQIESVNKTWQGDDIDLRRQQEALRQELIRLQVVLSSVSGC